jgi:hypothetical protein
LKFNFAKFYVDKTDDKLLAIGIVCVIKNHFYLRSYAYAKELYLLALLRQMTYNNIQNNY